MRDLRTPDFSRYPREPRVARAAMDDGLVRVTWADGTEGCFHFVWLRDNCAAPGSIDPDSRERIFDILDIPEDVSPLEVGVTEEGALRIRWSDDGHASLYHPGWLRAHCYSLRGAGGDPAEIETWDAGLGDRLPVFAWPEVERDPARRLSWLGAVRRYGIAVLQDAPTDLEGFKRVARAVGVVRDMNWGMYFEIVAEPQGRYISNKSMPIVPHMDGPTREYAPGLQIFQCVENSAEGGESYWVDGFHVAEALKRDRPDDFDLLARVPWECRNRDRESDYRWRGPLFETDAAGRVTQIRDTYWLRAPLMADFDEVPRLYRAYRRYAALTRDPANQVERKLQAGDVSVIDNRRVLHARRSFDPASGRRHIRTCYSEREELESSIRMLERVLAEEEQAAE
jgi:gamma-butyrobetaine dioxygenase